MGVQEHLQDTALIQHRSYGFTLKEVTEFSGVLPLAKIVSNSYLLQQVLQQSKNIKKETDMLSAILSYFRTVNIPRWSKGAWYILKLNY